LGHRWVIVFGVFDPDESEHWRGFAGILGQIVIFLLDVMEEIYIYIGKRAKITRTPCATSSRARVRQI
jgi:hypothetical protein